MASGGSVVGTGLVKIVPDARGIKGSITNALNGEADGAGAKIGSSLAGKLKKVIMGAGIGVAIGKAISQGAELEQNLGGTEAVFGRYAESIQAKAQTAYKNMGLSASDYMATANKMGSLFQGSGIKQVKALDMTADAMQRASDVASVMGIDTSMAMESIAGMAKGNFTMMDNLGVAMNATTLQAYALEKGVNFKWNTASNAEKAELAMEMFMDRTKQYAGNYAREADETLSGSLESMRASLQNVLGNLALGQNVQRSMQELVKATSTFLFGNLIPAIGRIAISIPGALASGIKAGIPEIGKQFKSISGDITEWFANGGVDAGIDYVVEMADGFLKGLPKLLNAVAEGMGRVGNWISNNSDMIGAKIGELMGKLAQTIIKNLPQIAMASGRIALSILGALKGLGGALFRAGTSAIKNFIKSLLPIDKAVQAIKNKIKNMFSGLKIKAPKMPSLHISWSTASKEIGGLKISVPKPSLKWYASGGIANSPSIAGIGEAGSEGIVPLDPFWAKLDKTLADMKATQGSAGGVVNMVMNIDGESIYRGTVDWINGQTLMFNASPLVL